MSEVINKIVVPKQAKFKVYWDDRPENYSRGDARRIVNYFHDKYGIDKNSIKVHFRPHTVGSDGVKMALEGTAIENVLDQNYQRGLFKKWLEFESIEIDINRLLALDDKVNAELPPEFLESNNVSWNVKWIKINNLLSFGESNTLNYDKLKGLNIVNSEPKNQGGKTTMTIDAVKFLFLGKTSKTDKNEEIFNSYREDDTLSVKGLIDYDGEEFIIERKLRRKLKTDGTWGVTSKVNFYKIMPDGEEIMYNDEDTAKTTREIKKLVGKEADFDLMVLTTTDNLDNLINYTSTESGKVFTKLIGLEVIEKKEGIVRDMYNTYARKMKSNNYDIPSLEMEITDLKTSIETEDQIVELITTNRDKANIELAELESDLSFKISSIRQLDETITTMDPDKLDKRISDLLSKGLKLKDELDDLTAEIKATADSKYDELKYSEVINGIIDLNNKISKVTNDIAANKRQIDNLKNGEICQSCQQPIKGVDNSAKVTALESEINAMDQLLVKYETSMVELKVEKDEMETVKAVVDARVKKELDKDKKELLIKTTRLDLKDAKSDLAKYDKNKGDITFNHDTLQLIELTKTKIQVVKTKLEKLTAEERNSAIARSLAERTISEKEALIQTILTEKGVERIFKVYIDMVGRKGISKLVLRSVLPLINSELDRLLDEICDFGVEIEINTKNELIFNIVKDGVSKRLKSASGLEKTISSLAIRIVLGRLTNLPKPNFIIFDEVLGKMAQENIEKVKPLFDKMKDLYEVIFLITHNDVVKDWGDNVLTVYKEDNVSTINIK